MFFLTFDRADVKSIDIYYFYEILESIESYLLGWFIYEKGLHSGGS